MFGKRFFASSLFSPSATFKSAEAGGGALALRSLWRSQLRWIWHTLPLPAAALHERPTRGRAFSPLAFRYFDFFIYKNHNAAYRATNCHGFCLLIIYSKNFMVSHLEKCLILGTSKLCSCKSAICVPLKFWFGANLTTPRLPLKHYAYSMLKMC